jgi:hypothetical protein
MSGGVPERIDAMIEGVDVVTVGTKKIISVDWHERDGQAFGISGGTVTLFDEEGGNPAPGLVDLGISVTTGIGGKPRVQAFFQETDTDLLTPGPHYVIWSLTLEDSTTRRVKGHMRVRDVQ